MIMMVQVQRKFKITSAACLSTVTQTGVYVGKKAIKVELRQNPINFKDRVRPSLAIAISAQYKGRLPDIRVA